MVRQFPIHHMTYFIRVYFTEYLLLWAPSRQNLVCWSSIFLLFSLVIWPSWNPCKLVIPSRLFHEKTHFLILAGSVFCQKMIKAVNRSRLTALIIFWQNTLPANVRKWVFSWNKRDGITWRNYKFAGNSWYLKVLAVHTLKYVFCFMNWKSDCNAAKGTVWVCNVAIQKGSQWANLMNFVQKMTK